MGPSTCVFNVMSTGVVYAAPAVSAYIVHCCGYTGLFCVYIELFCGYGTIDLCSQCHEYRSCICCARCFRAAANLTWSAACVPSWAPPPLPLGPVCVTCVWCVCNILINRVCTTMGAPSSIMGVHTSIIWSGMRDMCVTSWSIACVLPWATPTQSFGPVCVTCVSWLIHLWESAWHDSFMEMTHSALTCVCYDSYIHERVGDIMSLIHM